MVVGVDSLVFPGEVKLPVGVEVTVFDYGAEGEDCLGAGQSPSGTADFEAVRDEVAGCSFDDSGGDRPAVGQSCFVTEKFEVTAEIADGRLRAFTTIR